MEDLTKTQLILLTLLISFVVSIGTGIITVSLLNEAPQSVTQTINRVVERTVEKVVPDITKPTVTKEVTTVVVKEEDLVIDAIDKNTKSIVRVRSDDGTFLGLGIVVSKDGVVVIDRKDIISDKNYFLTFFDDKVISAPVLFINDAKSIAFLKVPKEAIQTASGFYTFYPATFSDSNLLKLGQTVISLNGEKTNSVSIGRISRLVLSQTDNTGPIISTTTPVLILIETDVNSRNEVSGGPLLNLNGEIIGIKISDVVGNSNYLPINNIKQEILSTITP